MSFNCPKFMKKSIYTGLRVVCRTKLIRFRLMCQGNNFLIRTICADLEKWLEINLFQPITSKTIGIDTLIDKK